MRITEIAFSFYPVTDMAAARVFYEGVLGLKVSMDHLLDGGHWVEYDIGAGTLAIGIAPGLTTSPDGCSVALEVEDFDAAIAEQRSAGVSFQIEPFDTPVCRMTYVRDPDGNSICIHRRKPGHH